MSQELSFTGDQLKAINHKRGHLRIIACPGSGKTEVVSNRTARLIEAGVNPKTIVAFTFTEKAAEQLKTRVRTILEKRSPQRADFGDMFIGTIHSFCFFMLKEIDPSYRSFDVLDDPRRVAFVSKPQNFFAKLKLVRLQNHHKLRRYDTVRRFLEAADIVMTENIDPSKLSDRRFAKCYTAYRELLEEEKYFDFSSILHKFVETIRTDRQKQKELGIRVKHIIVDEYQDVNRIQELLVELISRGADSVCVVGDDDQNIFHWRGSDVAIIRTFKQRYRKYNISEVHIDTNFRSTDAIVYTARNFIEHNKERLSKNMMSSKNLKRRYEEGDLFYRHFADDGEEFGFILEKIGELNGTDFIDKRNNPFSLSYSDFAILVRTNEDASRIVDFLDRNHIPCISHSGTSIFERPVTELAMDCIAYVFASRGYSTTEPPKLGDLEARYTTIFNKKEFPHAKPESFSSKLAAVRKEAGTLLARKSKDYFGDLGLQGFYYKILNAMGAEEFDFGDVFHYNLAALSAAISDYESVWVRLRASEVDGFFYFVYAFARGYYAESAHSDPSLINAVHVLTIHKAKGLEFPVVFIPNFEKKQRHRDDETFVDSNLYDSAKYSGTDEDERRVYYTAMTRSEKYLFVTGSKEQDNRRRSYEPHHFLEDINLKYFSKNPKSRRRTSGYKPKSRNVGTFPTSFSNLNCYGRCPQDFRLRHVYQYNAGVPVTFGYGTNVHNMLNIIHSSYIAKRRIPDEAEISRILDRIFKLRYATQAISERMKKSVLKIVRNYVRLHKDDFSRILETEKKFEFVLSDALISGQIDLLKKVDESGKVTEVEIIDFKTDRNDSVYQGDYDKQLRFYAIACLESLGLKPQRAHVHHLDQNTRSYVDISQVKLDEVRGEINGQISAIMDRKFPPTPEKILCSECDYRVICPHKKFIGSIK